MVKLSLLYKGTLTQCTKSILKDVKLNTHTLQRSQWIQEAKINVHILMNHHHNNKPMAFTFKSIVTATNVCLLSKTKCVESEVLKQAKYLKLVHSLGLFQLLRYMLYPQSEITRVQSITLVAKQFFLNFGYWNKRQTNSHIIPRICHSNYNILIMSKRVSPLNSTFQSQHYDKKTTYSLALAAPAQRRYLH